MDGISPATLYFGERVRNSSSTLLDENQYLPTTWIVTLNQK